ncbi:hypothetical protein L1987_06603 [Smallanthus sonchifolius]|uniref:Uncharacterized protein n=1 Tax=Smallanthus sonchifolius TaxID=185202 RepID=A0ACB9JYP3_9ASTR|nr:hypothetical protein L1987_06603 [Smallanthus sonchifolius]
MENFKEALIQFAHSNPSLFPNDASNSYPMLIEECFHQFFHDFQNPNHQTYAAMIYRAIRELNKKGGSSEKSISKFIKKENADLPWAHSTMLKHHLEKLCARKEICMTHKQCYLHAGAELESEKKSSQPRMRKRKRKRILKSNRKSSKRVKKHAINEDTKLQLLNEASLKQKNEVTEDESHEQKLISEVNRGDIQIQEQNEVGQESQHIQMKNPEPLQPEESPNLKPILHENDKRVACRYLPLFAIDNYDSESTDSAVYADMPKDKPDIVEPLSNEHELQQISRSPSLEKPLIELLKPISSTLMARFPDDEPTTGPSSTEVQDLKDQQPEKSTSEVKPKYKRRGRHPKRMKSQKTAKKGKVGNTKVQPKHKRNGGDKKTTRSSRKQTKSRV